MSTPLKLNLRNISADEVLVNPDASQAYVKLDVGEKIYNINGEPYIVVKFSDACQTELTNTEADFSAALLAIGQGLQQSQVVNNGENNTSTTSTPDNPSSGDNAKSDSNYICGVPVQEFAKKADKSFDSASLNDNRMVPAAVAPIAAAIPMRSNLFTYGPFFSSNFDSYGGANIEQNTDLAPWVFGNASLMSAAGQALANAYQTGLNKGETGSVTVPGLPSFSLGMTGGGPNLTGINVTFGSSGITTNYNFQTFTPKFGSLTQTNIDHLKNIARNRQKQLRFLRNQAITSYNIQRKLNRVKNALKNQEAYKSKAESPSLHRVIVGNMEDWYTLSEGGTSQRTSVGMDTLSKSVLELRYNYEKKAFMSLDGLYAPISKNGSGDLPQYASFTNENTPLVVPHKASPLAPHPPFATGADCNTNLSMDQYNLNINQKYLDPLTNTVSSSNHYHTGDGAGHAIDLIGREQEPPSKGMLMNHIAPSDEERYSQDYRFLGLRGPLVLHAWGYDTDGKPVPNEADSDSDAGSGSFKSSDLKDKFLKDWLNKPKTWPVAPVDLRFDRERGMWVSPQSYKIVVAKIVHKVDPFGEGKAVLINEKDGNKYYKDLYDENGNKVTATDIGDASCDTSITTKEYEWVVINAGECERKYYCYTIGNNYQSSECLQANAAEGWYNDPDKGPRPPIKGPFDICSGECKQYGACCYETNRSVECVEGVEKSDCEYYYNGTFHFDKMCNSVNFECQRLGSCCYYDAETGEYYGCDDNIPEKICTSEGGTHRLGITCAAAPCKQEPTTTPSPDGACCYFSPGNGVQCLDGISQADCMGYTGEFYPSSNCDAINNVCSRTGACCYFDSTNGEYYGCDDDIPEWLCNQEGGVHHYGASCDYTSCQTHPNTTTTSSTTPTPTTTTNTSLPPIPPPYTTYPPTTTYSPNVCNISEVCIDYVFEQVWARILANTVTCETTTTTTTTTTTSTSTTTSTTIGVPSAPTNLVATPGDHSISLSWDPPQNNGGSPLEGYIISYSPNNGSPASPIGPTGTTSFTIFNLDPNTSYTFNIIAINYAGNSGPAATTTATPNGANTEKYCLIIAQSVCVCRPESDNVCEPNDPIYDSQAECLQALSVNVDCGATTTTTTTTRRPRTTTTRQPTTTTSTTTRGPTSTYPPYTTKSPPPTKTPTPTSAPNTTEAPPTPPDDGSGNLGSGQVMIKVVDRIGKRHRAGDMVYAYYDTYKSEYVILESHKENTTPTIFGQWDGTTIKVEGTAGLSDMDNINIGSSITVYNRLKLAIPEPDCTVRAVAVKFLKSSTGIAVTSQY